MVLPTDVADGDGADLSVTRGGKFRGQSLGFRTFAVKGRAELPCRVGLAKQLRLARAHFRLFHARHLSRMAFQVGRENRHQVLFHILTGRN